MTGSRRPVSSRCDPAVWDAARAASQGMLAHDPTYSLSQLLEDALTAEIVRLEQEYNDGAAWPDVATVRPGRRTGRNGDEPEVSDRHTARGA